jgi:uncharacterized repeat protein (TIGR01451 family)
MRKYAAIARLFAFVFCVCSYSFNANASHIVGADFSYKYVSGSTYKLTLVLWGDCGPSSALAFAMLPTSTPQICIYNRLAFDTSIYLQLDSSASFTEITPLCIGDSSQCTNISSPLPGVRKYVYSNYITLPVVSSCWRFIYDAYNGSGGANAMRAADITNITSATGVGLIDTLNDSGYINNSPDLTLSTPVYFMDGIPQSYCPFANDTDHDSLYFGLRHALNAPANCTDAMDSVTYVGSAWFGVPISDQLPMNVVPGAFSFSSSTGTISFTASCLQRDVVVYNIREFRGGVMVGSSQREMTFTVLADTPGPGIPCFGSIYAGSTEFVGGCGGDTLSLSGAMPGCGIDWQWQSSMDGRTWTDIGGAIRPVYTFTPSATMYYRCEAVCSFSSLSAYSIPLEVPVDSAGLLHLVISTPPDTVCHAPQFYVYTCGSSGVYHVITYYGDGSNDDHYLTTTPTYHAAYSHVYAAPGTYTVKEVLYNGSIAVDSQVTSYEYTYCHMLPVAFYYDANSDCMFDSGDSYSFVPISVEVDSNGIPVDTISATSGLYYKAYGPVSTIYSFHALSGSAGMLVSCPSSGYLYDTISAYVDEAPIRYFGLACGTSSAFDLGQFSSFHPGPHSGSAIVLANNSYCTYQTGTLVMDFSPKYNFVSSFPSPTTIVGNELTWIFDSLTSKRAPVVINASFWKSSVADLPVGDTVNSDYVITPISGDINPANNSYYTFDSVKSAYDPNEITVFPSGYISAGTNLQYTISFENTGNASAQNIHVMDTLPAEVELASLRILAASSVMNISKFNDGANNIIKFDFPNIQLPDSSHHNQCIGSVIFSVNSLFGLLPGTVIPNRAGIFFDDNPVVMTNTVNNIIPNQTDVNIVGIGDDQIVVYPDPAKNLLHIEVYGSAYNYVTISNVLGTNLISAQIGSNGATMPISDLSPGVYCVMLSGNGRFVTRKFVKM